MSISITINVGRIDWPEYRTINLAEPIRYDAFRSENPSLFENSRKLLVYDEDTWRRVRDDEKLSSSHFYRTQSILDPEKKKQTTKCVVCKVRFDDYQSLRYHTGHLISHAWSHGITHKWEWSCCRLIVSHSQVERLQTAQGCNFGKCINCIDKSSYQTAIRTHQQEIEDAF